MTTKEDVKSLQRLIARANERISILEKERDEAVEAREQLWKIVVGWKVGDVITTELVLKINRIGDDFE